MATKYVKGDKIGELVFLSYAEPIVNGGSKRAALNLMCHCGQPFTTRADHFKNGNTKSCGCVRLNSVKEALFIHYKRGDILNGLTYLEDVESKNGIRREAKFICLCGVEFSTAISSVKNGHTNSCGCYKIKRIIETHTKHSMCDSSEYLSWAHMKNRCTNPKHEDYNNYGGRGISVCNRWMDFVSFLSDMGLKPTPKHTIERVDNDGNYEPSNCIWATKRDQNRNKRNTVYFIHNGVKKPLVDLIEMSGLNSRTVRQRVDKGWSADRVFSNKI